MVRERKKTKGREHECQTEIKKKKMKQGISIRLNNF